ncbi:hypothetical protein [Zoogloea sp.]|uniref:hypothetical protein n=1 Tax=Zoogloea sp. TaxID=49181 RepID=UPI0035AF99A7
MSAIPFTDRELRHAWRELSAAAISVAAGDRRNSHRLLLFYAVECGLKAVWLRRQNRTLFESADIEQTGHDLQQILKSLRVGSGLPLPSSFRLSDVVQGKGSSPRQGKFGDLHQAWRYGGQSQIPTDQDCEQQLLRVLQWIQGELK